MTVSISTKGDYPELPVTRDETILKIIGGGLVKSIELNGKDIGIQYQRFINRRSPNTGGIWTYCHKEIATIIVLPPSSIAQAQSYTIYFEKGSSNLTMNGIKGAVARGALAKAELDIARITPGAHSNAFHGLADLALYGDNLSRSANDVTTFFQILSNFKTIQKNAYDEINNMSNKNGRHTYVMGLLQQ